VLTDVLLSHQQISVVNNPAAEKAFSASTELGGMFSKAL